MNSNDENTNNLIIICERRKSYLKKQEELKKRCSGCQMRSVERCDDCIIGLRLRWLETEYSDVTGFTHDVWKNM